MPIKCVVLLILFSHLLLHVVVVNHVTILAIEIRNFDLRYLTDAFYALHESPKCQTYVLLKSNLNT